MREIQRLELLALDAIEALAVPTVRAIVDYIGKRRRGWPGGGARLRTRACSSTPGPHGDGRARGPGWGYLASSIDTRARADGHVDRTSRDVGIDHASEEEGGGAGRLGSFQQRRDGGRARRKRAPVLDRVLGPNSVIGWEVAMATENEVNAAKVRTLDAATKLLEALTTIAVAAAAELAAGKGGRL